MYLSLPLPSTVTREITVTVFYGDGTALPMPFSVTVLKDGSCKDLLETLSDECYLRSDKTLLLAEVYSDLEVAFVISEEETIFKALTKTAELLGENTTLFCQYYYGYLFHELLAFQLTDRHPPVQRKCTNAKSTEMIGFSSSAISVLNGAEFFASEADNSSLIHMDVDQSFLSVSAPVKAAIFESFVRHNMIESEIDVKLGI
ncbi:hypothetical protein GIB67_013670 [Kingdonia uniflora]|uniref:Uncharacterized protein n=1 Tax=Kingdonia uniflora TaxID=39325 RepID=A0A7J7NQB3_9MAGN|nr:hypothetical protein GIB67_013670 [Kingdonia uniflora]